MSKWIEIAVSPTGETEIGDAFGEMERVEIVLTINGDVTKPFSGEELWRPISQSGTV